jgi:hypothetical protein
MWQLPLPFPEDRGLADFVKARYLASPEQRAEMEEPELPRTLDGLLAACHVFYQNGPWIFVIGWLIAISAALHGAFRLARWLS